MLRVWSPNGHGYMTENQIKTSEIVEPLTHIFIAKGEMQLGVVEAVQQRMGLNSGRSLRTFVYLIGQAPAI